MLTDYHVHTEYSDDSTEPLENMVKKAIELQIDEICFTDHVDYGIKYDVNDTPDSKVDGPAADFIMNVDYPMYFQHIKDMQEKYKDRIIIKKGLEFGIQVHTIPQFKRLYETYPMDFVILSCHQVDNQEFWNYTFQKGREPEIYIRRYYEEILSCMKQYKDYSVLGHLDMIQRYTPSRYPFENAIDIITEILKQAIKDGKGIEVNTSSFRYQLPDLMPERNILRLYHNLGGKIITVGSDCHQSSYMGDSIPYIHKELQEIGFTHFCTFQDMEPIFHPLN